MYKVELDFLEKNADLIDQHKWEELRNRWEEQFLAYTRQGEDSFSWGNCIDILRDPEINIDIFEGLTRVPPNHCSKCHSLDKVNLSINIKTIEYGAFKESSITSINMPGVTKIEPLAFSECAKLKEVNFANNLQSISSAAFQDCINLTKIDIPDSCQFIDAYAFKGCTNLNLIYLPKGLTKIARNAFDDCNDAIVIYDGKGYKSVGSFYNSVYTLLDIF